MPREILGERHSDVRIVKRIYELAVSAHQENKYTGRTDDAQGRDGGFHRAISGRAA